MLRWCMYQLVFEWLLIKEGTSMQHGLLMDYQNIISPIPYINQ